MQMFVLDVSPSVSAKCLADVHIRVIGREITMCLSSWYAKNMGHEDELPYKQFNHPVVEQFDYAATRNWAVLNADCIFMEYSWRFNKLHASQEKFQQLLRYRAKYGVNQFPVGPTAFSLALFNFVEKGAGVTRDLPIHEAVRRYRDYYRRKLAAMKVPVTYTKSTKPEWLEESK